MPKGEIEFPRALTYREDGVELGDAVGVRGLDAAQPGQADLGLAVAAVAGARVNARAVGVEDLVVGALDRLAGGVVEELEVVVHGDARLVLCQVRADVFAGNIWGQYH